eukprot:SAG22_NODE_159_length_16948_cov_14.480503_14_plen_96_part_00
MSHNHRYQDTGEAAGVEALYAPVIPKLRGPNQNETAGQGLFVVPGVSCLPSVPACALCNALACQPDPADLNCLLAYSSLSVPGTYWCVRRDFTHY